MAYGLTKDGLITKTFDVVTAELQQELTANLGQLNFNDNTVIGNMVNIFAEREVFIWQLCQSLYDSLSPVYAEGISLDHNCALLGIKRLPATFSYVTAQVTAENYSTLPTLTLATIEGQSVAFTNKESLDINNESCTAINLAVTGDTYDTYIIKINGITISYNKLLEDTANEIALGVKALIEDEQDLSTLIVTVNGATINIHSDEYKTQFSLFIESAGFDIIDITNNVIYYAEVSGAIPIPANSLVNFASLENGILAINNNEAGVTGTPLESDIDLRIRRKNILMLNGKGTLDSIRAKLSTLANVLTVAVKENTTASTQDGIPPHSFEAIVHGGADEAIAKAIWDYKPIGIGSYGSVYFDVLDSTNTIQRVYFSRPEKIYVFINIAITKNDFFVEDSITLMKADIEKSLINIALGQSIYYQSLYSIVYKYSGITAATIQLGQSTDPDATSTTMSAANIIATARQVLIVEQKRIEIIAS